MPDAITDKISENAQGPKQVVSDGINVEQHPLKDQIEADKYLSGKNVTNDFRKSIARYKRVAPGSV